MIPESIVWNKRTVPITQFDEDVWEELIADAEDEGKEEGHVLGEDGLRKM